MPHTLVLHIQNSDPIKGEVDELPGLSDTLILLQNPRRMDEKDLSNLAENVTAVFYPIDKMNFIEILSEEEEDQIIGFVRE